ncbi:MAG: cytochrome b/b6 domain-containing protein [Gammaproteobacteria bacterium]|nr:cytochrome b/b6 domain-containing protein [Gammaproteobacteria bacterium]
MNPQTSKTSVVWDPLLRLFHWSLAFFFVIAYLFESDELGMHSHAGYTVTLLVLFRLVWGLIGPTHALFSDFLAPPGRVYTYLRQLFRRTATRHIGHNPAGAAMIMVMLISLLVTAFTGMCLFAMEGSGPLVNTFVSSWPGHVLEDIHEFSSHFTLIMIIVHIVGVLLTSLVHKENLIKAMITGTKPPDAPYHGKDT